MVKNSMKWQVKPWFMEVFKVRRTIELGFSRQGMHPNLRMSVGSENPRYLNQVS